MWFECVFIGGSVFGLVECVWIGGSRVFGLEEVCLDWRECVLIGWSVFGLCLD